MRVGLASQIDGRSTYVTGWPRAKNGGKPLAASTPNGFEFIALILTEGGLLPYIGVAIHQDTPTGIYVLLCDQKISPQPAPAGQYNLVQDGDPALVTLGPTVPAFDAQGNPVGSTMVFSESETEARSIVEVSGHGPRGPNGPSDLRHFKGFPFDDGLIAVLSTTPGIVTQLTGVGELPPAGGARFTARLQVCR